MFDFESEAGWDVSQDAEILNKSLFNGPKRSKSQKVLNSVPSSGVIYDSDDETFTKKGMRKIKKKRKREKSQNGNKKETVEGERTLISAEKPKQLKQKGRDKVKASISENKAGESGKGKKNECADHESVKMSKKHRKKNAEMAGNETVKAGSKRRLEHLELVDQASLTENPSKKRRKETKEADIAEPKLELPQEPTKKKRNRNRKKKNNCKKNKYAHLALNRKDADDKAKGGDTLSVGNLTQKSSFPDDTGKDNPVTKSIKPPASPLKLEAKNNGVNAIIKAAKKKEKLEIRLTKADNNKKKEKEVLHKEVSKIDSSSNPGEKLNSVSLKSSKKQKLKKIEVQMKAKKARKTDEDTLLTNDLKAVLMEKEQDVQVKKTKKLGAKTQAKEIKKECAEANMKLQSELLQQFIEKSKLLNGSKKIEDKNQPNNPPSDAYLENKKKKKRKEKTKITMENNSTDDLVQGNKKAKKPQENKSASVLKKIDGQEKELSSQQDPDSNNANTTYESTGWSVWKNKSLTVGNQAREKLNAARFRYINEQLYTCPGTEAQQLFREDQDAFKVYHTGFENQAAKWPVNPVSLIIKQLKEKPRNLVIADFGCGDAKLAQSLPQKVHSFDLVALNSHVTPCDMTKVPLKSETVDVAVFCLSLMGTNLDDYIKEANRVLKKGGLLKIVEVSSRFRGLSTFVAGICNHGFQLLNKRDVSDMFYMMNFKKMKSVKKVIPGKGLSLKPCLYKRR